MKKYSSLRKGFTLVELMIVIAIIGILAAVLYPSMTGYLERSRDTNRQSAMQQVNLALSTYFTDRESYPGSTSTKCLKEVEGALKGSTAGSTVYVKNVPSDPQGKSTVADCATAGSYSYKWIKNNTGGAVGSSFKAAARVESAGNGNMRVQEYQNAADTGAMTAAIKTKAELTGTDASKKATAQNYSVLTTTAQ